MTRTSDHRHDRAYRGLAVGHRAVLQLLLGHARLADLPFERDEDPQAIESAAPDPGQELQLPALSRVLIQDFSSVSPDSLRPVYFSRSSSALYSYVEAICPSCL